MLGSSFYGGLMPAIAERLPEDLTALIGDHWRFGDMLPLRLMGMCHALALNGGSASLAGAFPSTAGTGLVDESLALECIAAWYAHPDLLHRYLSAAVQTNEVARSAALAMGLDRLARGEDAPLRLIEIGPSAGLNLRLDHFAYVVDGATIGGDPSSKVRIEDVWESPPWTSRPQWSIDERVGLDPNPLDPTDPTVAQRLRSFVWPDQLLRLRRLDAAIELAGRVPARLEQTADTAATLRAELGTAHRGGTLLMQSIVWQYIDREVRWAINEVVEEAGAAATANAPLAWLTFEVDEFDRRRAAVQLRRWPGGGGTLIAHADFHGRWVRPLG